MIAETQPSRNELCNKTVSLHSLRALPVDVKRSKEALHLVSTGLYHHWGTTTGSPWIKTAGKSLFKAFPGAGSIAKSQLQGTECNC